MSIATAATETQRLLRNMGAHTEVLAVLGLRLRTSTPEGRELLQACHRFLQLVGKRAVHEECSHMATRFMLADVLTFGACATRVTPVGHKFSNADEANQQILWSEQAQWLNHLGDDPCVAETVLCIVKNTSLCSQVRLHRVCKCWRFLYLSDTSSKVAGTTGDQPSGGALDPYSRGEPSRLASSSHPAGTILRTQSVVSPLNRPAGLTLNKSRACPRQLLMSAEGLPLQRMQTVVVQELAQAAPVRRMYLADDSVEHVYETWRI